MSNLLNRFLLVAILFISISACSTSEKASGPESSSMYPAWYVPSGFMEDSLAYNSFATAVSSDSIIAAANAELQARANLESNLAEAIEEVRQELEEDGSTVATNTDFIINLRNAHQAIENRADEIASEARPKEGYYLGFAQVAISKQRLKEVLENGFSGNQSYWSEISAFASFRALFE